MRKLVESVARRLKAFLAQRDDLALVVRSPEGEAPAILQILEVLEEQSTSDLIWKFPEPFGDAEGYTATLIESFAVKHDAVRLLQQRDGLPPWPLLPGAVRDEGLPPARRIRELMTFARSLLPTLKGGILVWAMFPAQVVEVAAWGKLVREVLQHDFPFPWCYNMRILVRDDPKDPVLSRLLEGAPRIAWYAPDLSPQAMDKAVEAEAADESLPLPERLQALLLAAATDFTHKRYPQALEKYQLLFDFHSSQGNHIPAAVALNGMGEVHRATGNLDAAGACFEGALVPATDGKTPNPAVMLAITYNLANLRAQQKRWADAEGYWDCVQGLAAVHRSPELRIQALGELGQARQEQGKMPEAVEAWTAAATVAAKVQKPELGKDSLERLRKHYQKSRERDKLAELEQNLNAAARQAAPTT